MTAAAEARGDTAGAIEFLRRWEPRGPWLKPGQEIALLHWLSYHKSSEQNLFFEIYAWWRRVLRSGQLPGYGTCVKEVKWGAPREYLVQSCPVPEKTGRRLLSTKLGVFFTLVVPELNHRRLNYYGSNGHVVRGWINIFPSLDRCRVAFNEAGDEREEWHG